MTSKKLRRVPREQSQHGESAEVAAKGDSKVTSTRRGSELVRLAGAACKTWDRVLRTAAKGDQAKVYLAHGRAVSKYKKGIKQSGGDIKHEFETRRIHYGTATHAEEVSKFWDAHPEQHQQLATLGFSQLRVVREAHRRIANGTMKEHAYGELIAAFKNRMPIADARAKFLPSKPSSSARERFGIALAEGDLRAARAAWEACTEAERQSLTDHAAKLAEQLRLLAHFTPIPGANDAPTDDE